MAGEFKPRTLIDGFNECSGGMNRGVKPILLAKNVLANAINVTVRGTFPTSRPAFKKVTLTFSSPEVQAAFEGGWWYSGCAYDPDDVADSPNLGSPEPTQEAGTPDPPKTGWESLMGSISGKLFQVIPARNGHSATVTEQSAATTQQRLDVRRHWLWQSENYVIWNDGISKPVFFNQFNSPTCRRSGYTAIQDFSSHNEVDFIIPPVGMGQVVTFHPGAVANLVVGYIVKVTNKGAMVVQSITGDDVDLMNQSVMPIGGNVVANTVLSWQVVSEELPPGRMGVYGMGRNSVCLPDGKNIVISDMVGGPSGTVTEQFRNSQLQITENFYLKGGGTFVIPGSVGSIKAMRHVSVLDQSLGQGPMQILTAKEIFSCMAPTDRSKWQTMTDPIMPQSLIGNGATGQDSTINAGGDLMFRSPGGIASLILGRRDFATWGNTTCSREVDPILYRDSPDLLEFGSSVEFDNRLLMTCGPTSSPQGYYFNGLIALNFDPLSSLRGKAPAVYDGLWTGLNILQVIAGEFNGRQRCFAFTYNAILSKIELYEILKSGDADYDDGNYLELRRISWVMESPVLMGPAKNPGHDLLRLKSGEIRVDNLKGKVDFFTFYKPDQYPGWIPWFAWQECAKQPTTAAGTEDYKPQFRPRMGLGEPDERLCDETTGRPLREAHSYQMKVIVVGHCDFLGCDIEADAIPQTGFAPQSCTPICE